MSILSICIPTYNRAKLLDLCIGSFINEAIKYNIDICISDNNSKDKTFEIVNKYKQIYKNIFYKKQKETISIDHNMLEVLKLAKTEYALWLGDDDLLKSKAIFNILKLLNQKPDLLVLKISQKQVLKQIYSDPFSFFYDYGMIGIGASMHFSSLIVKVNEIIDNKNIYRFYGTYHLYAGGIFDYLLKKYETYKKILVLSTQDVYIELGTGNKTWSNKMTEVFYIFIPKWIDLFDQKYKNNALFQQKTTFFLNDLLYGSFLSKNKLLHKILSTILKSISIKYRLKLLKIKYKFRYLIIKLKIFNK